MKEYTLTTSELKNAAEYLEAGDTVYLSGTVYTSRDAAHKRIMKLIEDGKTLPYGIEGAVIYYAGPTPTPEGLAIGSCGPTTSSRMDVYAPKLLDMGLTAMGVAQGGIVDDPEGNWYSVMFQDSGAIGRIPVLCPVTWENGLPVFGTGGKVPTELSLPSMKPGYEYTPLFGSDDFKDNFFEDYKEGTDINRRLYGCFGLKSFWQFSHEPDLSLVSVDKKAGALRISTDKTAVNIHQARNVLTQRMISPGCAGEITVDASDLKEGDYAGITVYQGNYIWIGVTRRNGKLCAVTTTFTSEEDTWITAKEPGREQCCMPIEDTTVRLRLEASFGPGRDEAFCSILDDSEWKEFGPKHKLSFRLDHFTGARFGLFIYSTKEMGGSAAFSDFTYEAF